MVLVEQVALLEVPLGLINQAKATDGEEEVNKDKRKNYTNYAKPARLARFRPPSLIFVASGSTDVP